MHHQLDRYHGHVLALAAHFGLAQCHRPGVVRHIFAQVIETLVFQDKDRVILTDCAAQQPIGIGRRARGDDLNPRRRHQPRFGALAVLGAKAAGHPLRGPDGQRRDKLATAHVAILGNLIDNLIHGHRDKVGKHQLRHGAQPSNGRAQRCPNNRLFRNWGIAYTIRAKLLEQPRCHLKHTTSLGHIFTKEDHIGITAQLIGQRFAHRFTVSHCCHICCSLNLLMLGFIINVIPQCFHWWVRLGLGILDGIEDQLLGGPLHLIKFGFIKLTVGDHAILDNINRVTF